MYKADCMHKYCIPCATNMRKNLNQNLNEDYAKLFAKHAPGFQCPLCKPPGWSGPPELRNIGKKGGKKKKR